MPDTGGIQVTDTAEFFPQYPIPNTTTTTQISNSLDIIANMLKRPIPPHTKVIDDERIATIINGLRTALGMNTDQPVEHGTDTDSSHSDLPKHRRNKKNAVTRPRVQKQNDATPRVQKQNAAAPRVKSKNENTMELIDTAPRRNNDTPLEPGYGW